MWNSENVIRLELGEAIIKAANSPDSRNWFKQLFGAPLKDDAQLILSGIKCIRNDLSKKGILLPSIQVCDNLHIKSNQFVCYWGIEKESYSISHLNDLFSFITNKAEEYGTDIDKEDINDLLSEALIEIKEDNVQESYECYLEAYYFARKKNLYYECAQALTEVSGIVAANGQIELAGLYAKAAIQYSNMYNIVDRTLKCNAYLNAASIYKYSNPQYAKNQFANAGQIAFSLNNPVLVLFSLIGIAETNSYLGHIEDAISFYEKALIITRNNNSKMTIKIQEAMLNLYHQLMEYRSNNRSNINITNGFVKILNVITSCICYSLTDAVIFKLFAIEGGSSVISIGTKYNISNNNFNKPTMIGDKNTFRL